ncbi:MAG: hypothetical protein AB8I08_16550 [Sandaracinaceae bacterium]
MHAIYSGLLIAYAVAISARLAVSAFRGEGHTWSMWDGGLLLRGKHMSPVATWVAFAVSAALTVGAAVMLGPRVFL